MKIFGFTIERTKPKDEFIEVLRIYQAINDRKLQHLHTCIETICASAKVPYVAPKTFITELELETFKECKGEKAEMLKKLLLQSFNETEPNK